MTAPWKIKSFGTAVSLILACASAQSSNTTQSCVQLANAVLSTSPCDRTNFAFTMEGNTSIEANTVNFAAVVDGSGSVLADDWDKEKNFTKKAAAAFADRNLLENGGTASYVQFSSSATGEGTFTSLDDFDDHVDADDQIGGGTNIGAGIYQARQLMNDNPSSAAFMIVITDGDYTVGEYPGIQAGLAADEGTIIFAVGVGTYIDQTMLQDIAGTPDRVFDIDNFDELDVALGNLLSTSASSRVPCNATGVELNVEFGVPITSAAAYTSATGFEAGATVSGNTVAFTAENLEDNPTEFETWMDTCSVPDNTTNVVLSITYSDDQNRSVDVASELENSGVFDEVEFYPPETHAGTIAARWFSVLATISIVVVSVGSFAPVTTPGALGSSSGPGGGAGEGGTPAMVDGVVVTTPADGGATTTPADDGAGTTPADGGAGTTPADGGAGIAPAYSVVVTAPADGVVVTAPADGGAVIAPPHGGAVTTPADGSSGRGGGNGTTKRKPSATLAYILMKQLQFVAMLSLVDYIVVRDSWFADFAIGLRWIHLWRPAKDMEDIVSDECTYPTRESDLSASVFAVNFTLIISILVGILVVHVLVVSGVEAYWLTKKTAADEVAAALGRDASIAQVESHLRETRAIPATATERHLGPVAQCRELSQSVWLYFPHVELLFLFYAFEGAVASHISVLRGAGCPGIIIIAVIALALYPVLMFVTVGRTIHVRIHPDDLFVFTHVTLTHTSFKDILQYSWNERSLFSWADKGEWTTVAITDLKLNRERKWFRVGFEPIFADYTKPGTWFVMISLVEAIGTACVCVLVDDSALQLGLLAGIQLILFVVIVWLNPYANRAMNVIHALLVSVNAVSLALEALSAFRWEGEQEAQSINSAVAGMQIIALSVVTILMYMDSAVTAVGAVCGGDWRRGKGGHHQAKEVEGLINAYTRREWFGNWRTMVRHNTFACARDTWEGLRRPQTPAAAPPEVSSESAIDSPEFFWTKEDPVPEVDASAPTLTERQNVAGSMAGTWGVIGAPSGPTPFGHTLPGQTPLGQTPGPSSGTMPAYRGRLPTYSELEAEWRSDQHDASGTDRNNEEQIDPTPSPSKSRKRSNRRRGSVATDLPRRSSVRHIPSDPSGRSLGNAARAFDDEEER